MNKAKNSRWYCFILSSILFFCFCSSFSPADNESSRLDKTVKLSPKKGNTYQMLRYLSERYDCMFIYDSRTVENNNKAEIKRGNYSLREAIYLVTGNRQLILDGIGCYISIRLPEKEKIVSPKEIQEPQDDRVQIRGNIRDKETNEAVSYCTVSVVNSAVNTVTNHEGDFLLSLHDSLRHSIIRLSHVAYRSMDIAANDLIGQSAILTLEPEVIMLPEVSVQSVDAKNVLQEYFKNRFKNYPKIPVYMDLFYREGIEQEKGSTELVEAVFKMYKAPYSFTNSNAFYDFNPTEMVKLEKMRSMVSEEKQKFINFKLKSGVQSLFQLDIVKYAPDFLDPHHYSMYDYSYTGTTFVDEQRLYVISFQPASGVKEPLYKGDLYIDAESYALVMARFEVYSKQIKEAGKMFVLKNDKSINMTLMGAVYTVLYRKFDGIYYLNYIRVDINFSAKKKMSFSGRNIHSWIEMVCTSIDTTEVKAFERSERLPVRSVFSETRYVYDISFWDNYIIIPPEERFLGLIHSSEIEMNN